jgi:hypothetical protein
MRKYICSFTDDIKYNLINNPNFTINLINQKLIDINNVHKKSSNNIDDIKLNDNNPINMINSEHNFESKSKKSVFSESSGVNSDSIKVNNENFINFHDEEIIHENFEEFKIDDGNDNDIYINQNFLYEIDTKNNNMENYEQNLESNKKNNIENTFLSSPQKKNAKTKTRRNAANKIMLLNKNHQKFPNNGNNTSRYFNPHNYDFHIIDINGQIDNKEISSESYDSDEDCIEVTESHKFEKPKLLFFEDYVKDKDKRRLTKIDSIEIKPDQNILNQKRRLNELNSISYNNIIDIVNDDPSILPKYQLNLNPMDFANYIKGKDNNYKEEKKEKEKEKEEKQEEADESKYIFYGGESISDSEDLEDD